MHVLDHSTRVQSASAASCLRHHYRTNKRPDNRKIVGLFVALSSSAANTVGQLTNRKYRADGSQPTYGSKLD